MNRALIVIDGSNFFHGVKATARNIHLTDFDYRVFCGLFSEDEFKDICYYVGQVKREKGNRKSELLHSNQQKLFYNLKKQGIRIKKGVLLKIGSIYHEKGVDAMMALDILKGALLKEYDKVYIVSLDTDLLPAVGDAMENGKMIVYVGFDRRLSKAMSKNCSYTFSVGEKLLTSCGTMRSVK